MKLIKNVVLAGPAHDVTICGSTGALVGEVSDVCVVAFITDYGKLALQLGIENLDGGFRAIGEYRSTIVEPVVGLMAVSWLADADRFVTVDTSREYVGMYSSAGPFSWGEFFGFGKMCTDSFWHYNPVPADRMPVTARDVKELLDTFEYGDDGREQFLQLVQGASDIEKLAQLAQRAQFFSQVAT